MVNWTSSETVDLCRVVSDLFKCNYVADFDALFKDQFLFRFSWNCNLHNQFLIPTWWFFVFWMRWKIVLTEIKYISLLKSSVTYQLDRSTWNANWSRSHLSQWVSRFWTLPSGSDGGNSISQVYPLHKPPKVPDCLSFKLILSLVWPCCC